MLNRNGSSPFQRSDRVRRSAPTGSNSCRSPRIHKLCDPLSGLAANGAREHFCDATRPAGLGLSLSRRQKRATFRSMARASAEASGRASPATRNLSAMKRWRERSPASHRLNSTGIKKWVAKGFSHRALPHSCRSAAQRGREPAMAIWNSNFADAAPSVIFPASQSLTATPFKKKSTV